MGRKIGILGGTFNPIHNGHIELAQAALNQLHLDLIWFMPSGQTNLKKELYILPAKERIELIRLAINDYPNFELSQIEIQRPGITYTFETLLQLEEMFPKDELYFILGADCLFSIEKWKEPAIIMQKTILVSAVRGIQNMEELTIQADYLKNKYSARIELLEFQANGISSTQIRAKIAGGEPVEDFLPSKVAKYIKENRLFKGIEST